MKAKTIYSDYKRTITVIFGVCGLSVYWIGFVEWGFLSSVSVFALLGRRFGMIELWQIDDTGQDGLQVGIGTESIRESSTYVVDGIGNAVNKVLFALEIASESIRSEHLQNAEKHKMAQLLVEIVLVDRFVFA